MTSDAGERDRTRPRRAALAFPAAVLLGLLVLVGLNLNGSSISALEPGGAHGPSVLAGQARAVRGDEFLLATPLAVSAARQGFPDRQWTGLVDAPQLALAHGAPTGQWLEVFKPQDWGYLALGAARGLAWHWWLPYASSLIGLFVLLTGIGTRTRLAAVLAVLGTVSPYDAWWSAPSPGLFVGFAALMATCAVRALRARWAAGSLTWGLLGGLAAAAFALALYPPWQISLALLLVGLVAGQIRDLRAGGRRVAAAVTGFAATAVPPVAAWLIGNADAIAATAQTIYPGQRRSDGGGLPLAWLLDAPLNPLLSGATGLTMRATVDQPAANFSETSATWLPLPVLGLAVALLAVVFLRGGKGRSTPATTIRVRGAGRTPPQAGGGTLVGVVAVMAVLLVWALVPVPAAVGRVLLLDRAPGGRMPLALGVGAVVLLAIGATHLPAARRGWGGPARRAEAVGWLLAVAGTVALTAYSAANLPWDTSVLPWATVLLLGTGFAVGFGMIASGRWSLAGAIALTLLATASFSLVNPLNHGLGPLADNGLTVAMRRIARAEPGVKVEVYGTTLTIALVRAGGVQSLSGTTPYPDTDLMSSLLPGRREVWNNYATYLWVAEPVTAAPRIEPIRGTTKQLYLAPCSGQVLGLGARYAVSEAEQTAGCFLPLRTVIGAGKTFHIYRVAGALP